MDDDCLHTSSQSDAALKVDPMDAPERVPPKHLGIVLLTLNIHCL